jgi:hypothetical protein
MKYIKIFDKSSDYQTFKSDEGEYVTPNVCYINELDVVKFNPYIPLPAMAGDVAY